MHKKIRPGISGRYIPAVEAYAAKTPLKFQDESVMERLDDLSAQRFLTGLFRHIAYQFAANSLAGALLERDPETYSEVFRLLLGSE